MKKYKQRREVFLLLLKNTVFQFFAANLAVLIVLKLANSISWQSLQILLKVLGYGFYYYLATPFIIYWLAYASSGSVNRFKLTTTVIFMSLYSYILWDSYFYFTKIMNLLLSAIQPY